jgi:CRISPR-associated endonuclease Cas2
MKLPLTDKFLWMLYELYEEYEKTFNLTDILKVEWMRKVLPMDEGYWREIERRQRRKQFAQFIDYLKKRGYIKIANLEGKKGILLTPKGKVKALRAKWFNEPEEEFKKRKDGKWIMVIFDIPEKTRKYRDQFREFLYSLRFRSLQKSVWVCPYDVLKDLEELIKLLNIEKYVRIFLIEEIEV